MHSKMLSIPSLKFVQGKDGPWETNVQQLTFFNNIPQVYIMPPMIWTTQFVINTKDLVKIS